MPFKCRFVHRRKQIGTGIRDCNHMQELADWMY
jgi:hypothetical protein